MPVVSGTAFTTDASGELLTVHGVDVANESAVRVYESRDAGGLELDDPLIFLSQPDSIVDHAQLRRAPRPRERRSASTC